MTASAPSEVSSYGLRRGVLSPLETLAQSVSTIAPTTTPAATIPLVCALAGNGTFNLTNTASFDIPIDDISQNINFNGFPTVGLPSTTTPCNESFTGSLYVCPNLSGLGVTNKTIGSPRQIQMSLNLVF